MYKIANFIILFIILTLGNIVAPEYIVTDSWQTTLIVTLVCNIAMYIISIFIAIFVCGGSILSAWKKSPVLVILTCITGVVLVFCLPLLSLFACEYFIPLFKVNGVLTYFLLIAAMFILTISKKSEGNIEAISKDVEDISNKKFSE